MPILKVVNIKCGGCAHSITHTLEKQGFSQIKVSLDDQTVSFVGDASKVEKILLAMGYPKVGTTAANNLLKKAHSYVSCAIGKAQKHIH